MERPGGSVMVCKLVVVAVFLFPALAFAGEAPPTLVVEPPGIRLQVDFGTTVSIEARAALTADETLVLGGAIQVAGETHSGDITLDYGQALDFAASEVRRLVEDHRVEPSPDRGAAPSTAARPSWPQSAGFLQGVETRPVGGGRVDTWAGPLCFTLSFEEGAGAMESGWGALREPAVFERTIAREWEQIGRFIAAQGLPARAGHRSAGTLHVFAVSGPTMQAPVRRSIASEIIKGPLGTLLGFYEPLATPEDDSTITIAPVESTHPHTVLGHELAHYAFDLFGLSDQWRGTSETFARAFERWAY